MKKNTYMFKFNSILLLSFAFLLVLFSQTSLADDFGDAPNTYLTNIAAGGARHTKNATSLRIGTIFGDTEADGPAAGTGFEDDNTGTADEDGAVFGPLFTTSPSYNVTVGAVNTSGTNTGIIIGWIDFNRDGVFTAGEASASQTVPVNTSVLTNFVLTWNPIPGGIVAGPTYARIRITRTSSVLTAADFAGTKSRGEVEDYPITILSPPPTLNKSFLPTTLNTGQISTMTFTINNVAGNPVQSGIGFLDTLPVNVVVAPTPNIVNTTCTSNPARTVTAVAGTGTVTLAGFGLNAAQASCIVTVDVTSTTAGTYINDTARFSGTTNIDVSATTATVTVTVTTAGISGTVFEDVNYGGGAGRSRVTSSGVGRPNVSVELYNNAGNFVTSTTTNASGQYSFTGLAADNYTIRVVNTSVLSSRTGSATEIGIQTFRTNTSTGTAVAVTDHVGGQNPAVADAGNGTITTPSNLNTVTGVFTTATPGVGSQAQSITNVTLGATSIGNVDFGFNFDTIVNKNDAGQGSLRQFINNSNILTGNASLAQVGQTWGNETSIFMIPNGVANPGQNTGYTNQLTAYGAAQITLATVLPNITDANTIIDGSTQTDNIRTAGGAQTNPGQVGSGGNVGVSQTFLQRFDNPEVEIQGLDGGAADLNTTNTSTSFQLKNMAFSNAYMTIGGNSSLVQDNVVGMHADGTETGSTTSTAYCIRSGNNTSNQTMRHNFVKCNNSGIRRDINGSNWLVEYNEVALPAAGQINTYDGILLIGAGTNDTFQYNLIRDQRGSGSELGYTGAVVNNLVVQENTYTHNGFLIDGITASAEPLNIVVRNISGGSVIKLYRNIVANSGGSGVMVMATKRVWITENSIFNNGKPAVTKGLGIELHNSDVDPNSMGTTQDGVHGNDGTMNSVGACPGVTCANSGTDYPIITSAIVSGPQIRIQGYVGSAAGQAAFANAKLEFFKALDDGNNNGEILLGDGLSVPHGEGKIFIDSCNADASGNFDCTFFNQNVLVGQLLTSTATNSNFDTSQFSNAILATDMPPQFFPNNTSNALPGATIYFSHKYISSDPGVVTLSSVSSNGWLYTYFNDVNGNAVMDAGDTLYTGGSSPSLGDVYNLYASHSVNLLVKVQVPSATPINTTENLNITASLNITPVKLLSVLDIIKVSNIGSSPLQLIKSISPTGKQKPGTVLTFTITYTNLGSKNLSGIVINDLVPSFTNFISASLPGPGSYDAVTRKVTWTIPGTLAPGASGSVSFVVTIN